MRLAPYLRGESAAASLKRFLCLLAVLFIAGLVAAGAEVRRARTGRPGAASQGRRYLTERLAGRLAAPVPALGSAPRGTSGEIATVMRYVR